MSQHEAVGIIAGAGLLPAQLAHAVQRQGRNVFIIGLEGFVEKVRLEPFPHEIHRLAAVGGILKTLRAYHCRELVLIGPIKRPAWRELRPDAEGARILMHLGRSIFKGDDGLLSALVKLLEEKGFSIRGAHEFLSSAIGEEGILGAFRLDKQAKSDIACAHHVLRTMASLDIGQGCVVQNGLVLAVEALEGTEMMLQRCQRLKQDGPGGILLKMPKKDQEIRVDMPTIGPKTLQQAAEAGLRGIAFESGKTFLIDRHKCIVEADRLGLFLYGCSSYT